MPYRRCAVKRGSAAVLVFAFVIVASCGGTGATTTTTVGAGATAAAASSSAATGVPAGGGPSFAQVLSSAKATDYKDTYKPTTTVGTDTMSGQHARFITAPRARYDRSV